MTSITIKTQCCIAGGGPAGMMLGYLLARCGIETVILEKWQDFLRDFRGDTIHPSTMDNLAELGLLEKFLALPHQEVTQLSGVVGDETVTLADFSHLSVRCPFVAFVPQWDFLNFLATEGQSYPAFNLLMQTEATDVIEENGRIIGLHAKSPKGDLKILADLVVGADGRHSVVRERAGLKVDSFGAPMDVLWFRLSRKSTDPHMPLGRIVSGRIMVMIYRGDYWQCGFVIRKDSFAEIKTLGLPWFHEELLRLAPFLEERVKEIKDLNALQLLSVKVDRLRQWYRSGLLCIGDAAHAMSPVGGVGINLAIQDAIAAANILVPAFQAEGVTEVDLAAIQNRRRWPTSVTQRIQVFLQNHLINQVLNQERTLVFTRLIRVFNYFPYLRRIPARIIGLGVRAEHVSAKIRQMAG